MPTGLMTSNQHRDVGILTSGLQRTSIPSSTVLDSAISIRTPRAVKGFVRFKNLDFGIVDRRCYGSHEFVVKNLKPERLKAISTSETESPKSAIRNLADEVPEIGPCGYHAVQTATPYW